MAGVHLFTANYRRLQSIPSFNIVYWGALVAYCAIVECDMFSAISLQDGKEDTSAIVQYSFKYLSFVRIIATLPPKSIIIAAIAFNVVSVLNISMFIAFAFCKFKAGLAFVYNFKEVNLRIVFALNIRFILKIIFQKNILQYNASQAKWLIFLIFEGILIVAYVCTTIIDSMLLYSFVPNKEKLIAKGSVLPEIYDINIKVMLPLIEALSPSTAHLIALIIIVLYSIIMVSTCKYHEYRDTIVNQIVSGVRIFGVIYGLVILLIKIAQVNFQEIPILVLCIIQSYICLLLYNNHFKQKSVSAFCNTHYELLTTQKQLMDYCDCIFYITHEFQTSDHETIILSKGLLRKYLGIQQNGTIERICEQLLEKISNNKLTTKEFTFHYAAYLIQGSDSVFKAELQLIKLKKRSLNILERIRYSEIKNAVKKKLFKQCQEPIKKSGFSTILFSLDKKITTLTNKCSHMLYQFWDDMENETPKLHSCLQHGLKFIQWQNKLIKIINKYDNIFGIERDKISQLYSFFLYICEDKALANKIKVHKVKLSNAIYYNEDSPVINVMGGLAQGTIYSANQAFLKLVGLTSSYYKSQAISNFLISDCKCLQKIDIPGYVIHSSKFLIPVKISLLHAPSIETENCSVYSLSICYGSNDVTAFVQCNDDTDIIGLGSGILAYMNNIRPYQYNGGNINILFPELSLSVLKELPAIAVTISNSTRISLNMEKNWAGYLVKLSPMKVENDHTVVKRTFVQKNYPTCQFEYNPSIHLFIRSFCGDKNAFDISAIKANQKALLATSNSTHTSQKQITLKQSSAFDQLLQKHVEKLFNLNPQLGTLLLENYVYS